MDRCDQRDSKQQVRMNLGMNLIRKKVRYEVDFLHVVRRTQIDLFDVVNCYE